MAMKQHADVFAQLTSSSYQGDQQPHKGGSSDLEYVLERARNAGVTHIISGCDDLQDTLHVFKLSQSTEGVYCSISLDPGVFRKKGNRTLYLREVRQMAKKYRSVVVGVNLSGLPSCTSPSLLRRLRRALEVAIDRQLPMFLSWNKKSIVKFLSVFKTLQHVLPTTIIDSFEGSEKDAQKLLDQGFYLGISCSESGISVCLVGRSVLLPHTLDAIAKLPLNKILVHSGSPEFSCLNEHSLVSTKFPSAPRDTWRPGLMMKGRGEPACVAQVVEVVAARRGEDPAQVAAQLWINARDIFFPHEDSCTGVF